MPVQGLYSVAISVLIMNSQRQIIYTNKAFNNMIRGGNNETIHGLRIGEALECIHSNESEGGCGTTEFCRECGAVNAILCGLEGEVDVQECRISAFHKKVFDLSVMAAPLIHNDHKFTICSIRDIADEKRKEVLERIFLHDVMNTAGGLLGFSKLLMGASEELLELYSKMIYDLTDKMVDEINAQRQLIQAETNRLEVRPAQINTLMILGFY